MIEATREKPYDKVYVINRDEAVKRMSFVKNQLDNAGIYYERVSAVDGRKAIVTNLKTNQVYSGQYMHDNKIKTKFGSTYLINCNIDDETPLNFKHTSKQEMVAGELGLWCSNLMIWNDALKNNYKRIIIFEDDIILKSPSKFNTQLNNFISNLPSTYDVAYMDLVIGTGKYQKIPNNNYVSTFSKKFIAYGAWAMSYSEKGLKKLLSFDNYPTNGDLLYLDVRAKPGEEVTDYNLEVYGPVERFIGMTGESEMMRF
jgi:GR25 family glycosyltransferase involved in LPS biosynthesis